MVERVVDLVRGQIVTEGLHDGVDVLESWISLFGQGFLQTLAGDSRRVGGCGYSFHAADDAQGRKQRAVVIILGVFLESDLEKVVNFLGVVAVVFFRDFAKGSVFTYDIRLLLSRKFSV
jgi:hypothetical protein